MVLKDKARTLLLAFYHYSVVKVPRAFTTKNADATISHIGIPGRPNKSPKKLRSLTIFNCLGLSQRDETAGILCTNYKAPLAAVKV